MMSPNFVGIFLLLVLNIGLPKVLGVNLYVADNPLSTESLELRVVSRSKRDATSPFMPKYYVVLMNFGAKRVNANLKRQDVISGLVGHRRIYNRDWATYASDEVDGVFIVRRGKPTSTGLTIEGYMVHDMTLFLVQPGDTPGGHVIHQLSRQSTNITVDSFPFYERFKDVRRRDATLVDGRWLNMKTEVIADVTMVEFVRSRVGEAETNSVIQEYYAMLVNFVNKRFLALRKHGLNIAFKGFKLRILSSHIPGVVEAVRESSDPERKAICSKILMDKFMQFTQYDNNYDQVILLTGYDILSPERGISITKVGTKDNGCKEPGARSIVHFACSVETFRRTAHAIMKGFGVKNDGERGDELAEKCQSSDGYIMSEEDEPYLSVNYPKKNRWWHYSKCTYEMLRRYLKDLDQERSRTCLAELHTAALPHYNLGYTKTLDEQCQIFAGAGSYAKKDSSAVNNICKQGVTCIKPVLQGMKLRIVANTHLPLPGTPCGVGKVCLELKCSPLPPGFVHNLREVCGSE